MSTFGVGRWGWSLNGCGEERPSFAKPSSRTGEGGRGGVPRPEDFIVFPGARQPLPSGGLGAPRPRWRRTDAAALVPHSAAAPPIGGAR